MVYLSILKYHIDSKNHKNGTETCNMYYILKNYATLLWVSLYQQLRDQEVNQNCLSTLKTLPMKAYVIVEVSITDKIQYEEYKKLAPSVVAAFDGRFLVRGGRTETLEGDWQPERMVVVEFPSLTKAREWWNSDQYSKAKAIRQQSAHTKMVIVEGA